MTNFAQNKKKEEINMARPIKETPILTGADAEHFVEEMRKVESMSKEKRYANKKKLREDFEKALKRIAVCL